MLLDTSEPLIRRTLKCSSQPSLCQLLHDGDALDPSYSPARTLVVSALTADTASIAGIHNCALCYLRGNATNAPCFTCLSQGCCSCVLIATDAWWAGFVKRQRCLSELSSGTAGVSDGSNSNHTSQQGALASVRMQVLDLLSILYEQYSRPYRCLMLCKSYATTQKEYCTT